MYTLGISRAAVAFGSAVNPRAPAWICWCLGAALAAFAGNALAYQMVWKVLYVYDGHGTRHDGPATTYPSQAAALAAMQALAAPDSGGLTYEVGMTGVSPSDGTHRYIIPPKSPVYTPWSYAISATDQWGIVPIAGVYADEASAFAALDQWRTTAAPGPPPCVPPTFGVPGPWLPANPSPPPYGSTTDGKTYPLQYTPCDGGYYPYKWASIGRSRTITCPDSGIYKYGLQIEAPFCWQPGNGQDLIEGYIQGKLLECPARYGPSTVGDPCEVMNGDFSVTEDDYEQGELRFVRSYHSASLASSHNFGVGWTHNYSSQLITRGGSIDVGIVRPDGHQDVFESDQAGVWHSLSGNDITLKNSNGWRAYLADGTQEVFGNGVNNGGGVLWMLSQIVDAAGRTTTLNYTNGQLTSITDAFGHTITLGYSGALLTQLIDPAGQVTQYDYDAHNNLVKVTYPDSTTRTYQYEDSALPNDLTGITDETGTRLTTAQYDDTSGRVISSTQAGGSQHVSITYNSNNAVVTDSVGGTTTYTIGLDFYSNMPQVTGTSHNGVVSSWQPGLAIDGNGYQTLSYYDDAHLTQRTEAYGTPRARTTTYQHLAPTSALPTLVTEPLRQTSYTYYSGTNNVKTKIITDTTVTPNVSRTWTYTYDSYGRVLTADGPRTDVSDVTTYSYYTCTTGFECGELQTVTDAAGNVTTYNTYNAHGQPLTITDPNGVLTTLHYDARERLTSRQFGAETTSFDYWPTGLLKKTTQPDGSYLLYTYDDAHRLTKIQDALGNWIHYDLDPMGNRTGENTYDPINTLSKALSRHYNALNQLTQDVPSAGTAAVTTTYTYDNNGNQKTVQAPLARNSSLDYDELNRVKTITDAASGKTQIAYDANDQVTSVTDPMGFVTSYTNDGFGEVLQQTSPDTGTTHQTYDLAGNLLTRTDARGVFSQFTYDALNRQTQAHVGNGSWPNLVTRSFTYDTCANGKGHLCSANSSSSQIQWTYTPQGRVASRVETDQSPGGGSYPLTYTYTSTGQIATLTYPSGALIRYTYNANNQIASITVTVDGSTKTILNNVQYEPFGAVRSWTWGNGALAIRSHDADGNVSAISTTGLHLTYQYDNALRIQHVTDQDNASQSVTYGYDALDRINAANTAATLAGWTYDANGNMLSRTGTAPATLQYSGSNNRVMSYSTPHTSALYQYDQAGNATQSSADVLFQYDADGHLDYSGQLLSPTNPLQQPSTVQIEWWDRHTLYDDAGHIVGVYEWWGPGYFSDQPNQLLPLQETIYLGDLPVGVLMGQMTYDSDGNYTATNHPLYYVHADPLGTPRRLTEPTTNTVTWRWDSDPYGAGSPNGNPSHGATSLVYDLRLPGQIYNLITGQYDNDFRDYDPTTGRYIESDPIGLQAGINTYAYVQGNPISRIDPQGLMGFGGGGAFNHSAASGTVGVYVRCGSLPAAMGGSSGGVHCEVVATCSKTGETYAFGIGGGGEGIWDRLFGGKEPPKYGPPIQAPASPPAGSAQYTASCGGVGDCGCKAMECLKKAHRSNHPPPYYALWQNSNTYAHALLNQCGCAFLGAPGAIAW